MAQSPIRLSGDSTFAEHPGAAAPDARIIWRADFDPGALQVIAVPAADGDPNAIDPAKLARWLTLVLGRDGCEHAVLSDGWHRIRLDVVCGSLEERHPVVLHYRLHGVGSAARCVLPLRRLIHLCRHQRFAASLFPADRSVSRGVRLLQVHDAVEAGASHREIAEMLFGAARVADDWKQTSESLRSRVRRLIAEAGVLARGGYRSLMMRSR